MEINTSLVLNDEEKHELCEDIGKFIHLIPGKFREITMMNLKSGCYIEYPLKPPISPFDPCIMIEFRVGGISPFNNKRDFVREVTAMLVEKYKFEPKRVFVNFFEMDNWGFNGGFKSLMVLDPSLYD